MKKMITSVGLSIACLASVSGIADLVPISDSDEYVKSAQVYEISVTVKTSIAQRGKLSPAKNPFVEDSGSIIYRKQSTQTWKGLIWGCDCESALGKWMALGEGSSATVTGVVMWKTKKPYDIILLDDMRWHVLNAIDAQGKKCECAWTIGESSDESAAFLSFAGFGTLKLKTRKEEGGGITLGDDCRSYISSLSGTVSGWMPAPIYETAGRAAVCTFCGVVDPGEEGSVDMAVAWNYCPCLDVGDRDFTAVSGSWTLKYNATLSKKLSKKTSILEVYSGFPASVREAVSQKINAVKLGE